MNESNRVPVPSNWHLVGKGVLARNKNDPSFRYFGELYSTPNGLIHMISIFRIDRSNLLFFGHKVHLLKQDSTVLYQDPNVSYVLESNPVTAIMQCENIEE